MKRHHNAPVWLGGRAWLVLAVVLSVGLSGGCSTGSKAQEETTDEVIGRPPPADEDPFFVRSMPGEAVPVAASGKIEDEGDEAPSKPKHSPDTTAPSKGKSETTTPEAHASDKPSKPQCFSCVRICPAEGDCDAAKEDVICGWGVHEEKIEARRMAKAECDATLDMARQMPVWSEIAGECPVATCR